MVVTLLKDGFGAWDVWVAMRDGNPAGQSESFIIGCGSRAAADARQALHKALADLDRAVAKDGDDSLRDEHSVGSGAENSK